MTSGVLELNGLSLEKDGGEVDSMRMSVSRVTLAYLEDTGFFTADYQEAGFQKWGWQEGCLFITQVCDAWAAANPGQLHFCSTTQAETDEALKFRESGKPILTAILEVRHSLQSWCSVPGGAALCAAVSVQPRRLLTAE